jgi:asparagine synthase (glutamine-hydrolysing)
MCGICGVVQIEGEPRVPIESETLNRMTDAMVHRGPNDRGTLLLPGVAFGVRRLSIVDVQGGHQPFSNEDGQVWGMQNGELYNHDELRRRLARDGHRFESRCDTEVLPHLYERHGEAFVEELRGKFSLAVWDDVRRRAVIARDRLGIKPLYYARSGDLLVFASELKSLLASGLIASDLDLEGIDAYLTLGFFPAPRTPLAGVRKLMPGERLVVERGELRTARYWRFPPPQVESARGRSVDELATGLLDVLEEAVRLRLMSDVPLGAMLSGGLDSSLVVALMARNMAEPVKTFSVGFLEAGPENELARARAVAAHYGTDHHELELSFAQQQIDLNDLVWALDEPLADLSSLGFLALSQLASQTVTVALSGQGADELLGGYSRHRNAKLAAWPARLPAPAGEAFRALAALTPRRFRSAANVITARDGVERQLAATSRLDKQLRSRLFREPLLALSGDSARSVVASRLDGARGDALGTMLFLDGQLGLVDDMLHYFDRASMAWSLEVRVPFLDHHVVEYCASIPSALKVRGATKTKYLLKHAARGLVPQSVIDRPKVGFFNAAVGRWFRAQANGAISDYLLDESPAYSPLLDRREVERLVGRYLRGDAAGAEHTLLSILMLEVWLSGFVRRATSLRTSEGVAA